jgi:XTP/dITP diphosphohydrolase
VAGRIVLLVTSPRLPAGLLTAAAWDLVRSAPVFSAAPGPQVTALGVAGVTVALSENPVPDLLSVDGDRVWLAGPTGDEAIARELGMRVAREPGLAEIELMYGSWDPPGARLLDVVTVIDRLASPGGDPWKLAQTHRSLARYLLEEAYEAYDAMADGDHEALREELGDVLLQVVLHARLAQKLGDDGYSIDDVAGDLATKLIRRSPHVFGDSTLSDVEEINAQWERIKREEKQRASVLDGIAWSQPSLALAEKLLSRVQKQGLSVPPPTGGLGGELFAVAARALDAGADAEAELRQAARAYADAVREAERDG